jgi:hypothetical protein
VTAIAGIDASVVMDGAVIIGLDMVRMPRAAASAKAIATGSVTAIVAKGAAAASSAVPRAARETAIGVGPGIRAITAAKADVIARCEAHAKEALVKGVHARAALVKAAAVNRARRAPRIRRQQLQMSPLRDLPLPM